jgi:hypothetical protein
VLQDLDPPAEGPEVEHSDVEHSDRVLERLFLRYRRAMALNSTSAPDLRVVDEVIEARVTLYEHLLHVGWDPPPLVRRQLETDRLLLEQPPSALAG